MNIFCKYGFVGALGSLMVLHSAELSGRTPAGRGDPAPSAITLNVKVTDASCAYNNGIVVVTATGGAAPYIYMIPAIQASNGSGIFANLPPGSDDILVTDAAGTTATAIGSIGNVYTPPNFSSVQKDPTGCGKTDGSITINGNGGVPPYIYSIDEGLSYQTGNVFAGLGMGLYHIFIKDANGCVTSPWSFLGGSYIDYRFYNIRPVTQVLLNPACDLQLSAVPSGPVCGNNGFIEFFAAEGGTPPYTYSLDGINFAPNTVHGYTGLAPGKYTVYVRDAAGLTITVAVDIPRNCAVVAAPVPASCGGAKDGVITVTSANGIPPYTYSLDGLQFQTGNQFTGLAPGNYTVVVNDANRATSSADVHIGVACLSISLTPKDASCGRNNGSLTARGEGGAGPYTFSIDGVDYQNGNQFDGLAPGNSYTVFIKDVNGAITSAQAGIGDNPGPVLGVSATAASCVNNNGGITVIPQGGQSPFQYTLSGGNSGSSGRTQDNGNFSGLDSGMKLITVTDANGCPATRSAEVPLNDELSLDAGGDHTICEGVGQRLPASSNGVSFSWTPVTGLNDASLLNPLASPATTTGYTLTVVDGVCRSTGSVTVSVNPAPVADPGSEVIICSGKSAQLHGKGGQFYQWSPATYLDRADTADPMVIQPPGSIVYTLQVTDGNGCRSLGAASVQVTVTPPGKVFAGNDTSVVTGQPLQLHAVDVNKSGFAGYEWSPADGLNDPFSRDPVVSISGEISYTVTATTPQGCKGVGEITIKVYSFVNIFVPNAFTPNGDGHNDILKPIPAGIREFRSFAVYSRWGQQLFRTADPNKGWDGTINGRPQGAGTYIWTAQGIDYQGNTVQRKGMVILIR